MTLLLGFGFGDVLDEMSLINACLDLVFGSASGGHVSSVMSQVAKFRGFTHQVEIAKVYSVKRENGLVLAGGCYSSSRKIE